VLSTKRLESTIRPGTFVAATASWAQLQPGTFEVHYGFLKAGPLLLSTRRFTTGIKVSADLLPQISMICVAANHTTAARFFGKGTDGGSFFVIRSSVEISTEGPAWFCSLTLNEDSLAREFPQTPDVVALLDKTQKITLGDHPLYAHRLRTSIMSLFSFGTLGTQFTPYGFPEKSIYGTLVPLAAAGLEAVNNHAVEASKCRTKRLAAVKTCESYMHEHRSEPVTLLDLCAVAGMRSRSLINAFEAVTGFSPMDYLRRLRLSGAHHALQLADKKRTKIIDVATDWGFWHMGHFTHYYREMFGETPSKTLLG